MKKRLYKLFILLFGTIKVQACDCDWSGNFLEIAKESQLVALVKVVKYNNYFELSGASSNTINQPLSATFEIKEIISGTESRNKIEVFGDIGNLCRPYIDTFQTDKYYVVALNNSSGLDHENGIKETESDFIIWNCGEYWLDMNDSNQSVTGFIYKGKKKKRDVRYSELKENIQNNKSR